MSALESVSQIKSGGDIPRKLLEDINKSIQKIHDKTVVEYRRSYEERHKILKGMQPLWRSADKLMGELRVIAPAIGRTLPVNVARRVAAH